jgi:hypothetical protein
MAKDKPPQRPKVDPLAAEIDALLKKLPHADPGLRGDEPPPSRSVTASPPPARVAPPPGKPRPPDRRTALGVWGRVLLGVVFAAALTQWPYRADCGWPLYVYSTVVLLLLVVGAWGALASWRQHIGAAHLLSLVVVFWGLVLSAEIVLPRVGYAVDAATWRCQPPQPVTPARRPAVAPPLEPVQPDAAGPGTDDGLSAAGVGSDSVGLTADSATGAVDSSAAPDSLPG